MKSEKKGDRRSAVRKKLHEIYLPFYDLLCESLSPEWQPYQGYRSFDQQNRLFSIGRSSPGKIITNAVGGESAHCYGMATDWCIWDEEDQPIWPEVTDKKWNEYESACDKIGLIWGGNFSLRDNPHNELNIKCSWKKIKEVYDSVGIDNAIAFIKSSL